MTKGIVIALKHHYDHFIQAKGYDPKEWPLAQRAHHLCGLPWSLPVIVYGPAGSLGGLEDVLQFAHRSGYAIQYIPEV